MDLRLRTGAAAPFLGTPRQQVADLCRHGTITSIRAGAYRRLAPSEPVELASGSDEPHDIRVLRLRQPFITPLPINPHAVTADARRNRTLAGNDYPEDGARILESNLGTSPTSIAHARRARSPFTGLFLAPSDSSSFAPANARITNRTRSNLPIRHPPPLLHRLKTADHPNVTHTESRTPA